MSVRSFVGIGTNGAAINIAASWLKGLVEAQIINSLWTGIGNEFFQSILHFTEVISHTWQCVNVYRQAVWIWTPGESSHSSTSRAPRHQDLLMHLSTLDKKLITSRHNACL